MVLMRLPRKDEQIPDLDSFDFVLNREGNGIDNDFLENALRPIQITTIDYIVIYGTYHPTDSHIHFLYVLDKVLGKRKDNCRVVLISSLDPMTLRGYLIRGVCTDIDSRHQNFFALSQDCPQFFSVSTSDANLDNLIQLTE
jgi:hypothetical protein